MQAVILDVMNFVKHVQELEVEIVFHVRMDILYREHHVLQIMLEEHIGFVVIVVVEDQQPQMEQLTLVEQ